jgi:hypothetical protein
VTDCQHLERREGRCLACGDCLHEVILNAACFICGSIELDPIALSPKRPHTLIPPERLTKK